MVQLPECIRAAEQHARNSLAGQHDMFGASSSAPAPMYESADASKTGRPNRNSPANAKRSAITCPAIRPIPAPN